MIIQKGPLITDRHKWYYALCPNMDCPVKVVEVPETTGFILHSLKAPLTPCVIEMMPYFELWRETKLRSMM